MGVLLDLYQFLCDNQRTYTESAADLCGLYLTLSGSRGIVGRERSIRETPPLCCGCGHIHGYPVGGRLAGRDRRKLAEYAPGAGCSGGRPVYFLERDPGHFGDGDPLWDRSERHFGTDRLVCPVGGTDCRNAGRPAAGRFGTDGPDCPAVGIIWFLAALWKCAGLYDGLPPKDAGLENL